MKIENNLTSVDIPEILKNAGADKTLSIHQNYYLGDPLFGSKSLNPPPVPWLLCVYGINIDTEVSFITAPKPQKGSNLTLDTSAIHETLTCKSGLLFETADTEQIILEQESPEENSK